MAEWAARGWSDPDLAQLTSHDALRVLRDTESVARRERSRQGPSRARIGKLDGAALTSTGE